MSEEYFSEMTKFLKDELKDQVEFVYLNAPHVTAEPSVDNNFRRQRAWWLKTKDFPNVDFKACFEHTLQYLEKMFAEKGPFDGVLGFSQGNLNFNIYFREIINFNSNSNLKGGGI